MAFNEPCAGTSLEDPINLEQLSSPQTDAPRSLLYYAEEFKNQFQTPCPAIYPNPGSLGNDSPILLNQPPCLLIPSLDSPFVPWANPESCTPESWTMDASPTASTASDTFELDLHNAAYPAVLFPASCSDPALGYSPASPAEQFPFAHLPPTPDLTPRQPAVPVDAKSRAAQEPPSSMLPPPPRPPSVDHIPPYMTPGAIKARQLILQCDFPKDGPPKGLARKRKRAQKVQFLA
ncbi:hypothetical protein E4U55_006695 [Claviceps digitariae]|nr:hypothetical protein E4U55_006695 [Claviceps digitariae]